MLKRPVPGCFFRVGGHFHIIRRTKGVLGEKDVFVFFKLYFKDSIATSHGHLMSTM